MFIHDKSFSLFLQIINFSFIIISHLKAVLNLVLNNSNIIFIFRKKPQKVDTSLEERIRKLTCDIDETGNEGDLDNNVGDHHDPNELNELERRDSPAGEENPQQAKYIPDKSFSPSSSASSSSSGSTSAYKKITEIFNRDRRQERIPEADENPIVIIPQVSISFI